MSDFSDVQEKLKKLTKKRPEAQPTPMPRGKPPKEELEDESDRPKPNLSHGPAGY